MMIRTLIALFVLVLAAPALAQPPTIVSVKVEVVQGASPATVVNSQTYPWTSVTCNLVPTTVTGPVVNPNVIEFDDPAVSGRACRVNGATFLAALGNGNYFGQVYFNYSDGGIGGPSAQSNPFTRFLYGVATGLKFIR